MSKLWLLAVYYIGAAVLSACLAPVLIRILKRLKAGQSILGYVTQHEGKAGTPTMGGLIFLVPAVIVALVEFTPFSLVTAAVTAGFAILGFLDDFIKIKFNRNLGLKAYQKIIGQLGLSAAAAYFVYASPHIGAEVNIPFSNPLNFGAGIIPFVMLVYVATTNSVNLTDGLDGLAGHTTFGYFLTMTAVLSIECTRAFSAGDFAYADQLFSLAAVSVAFMGGLSAYLVFNVSPAKVFMGDTGSLGLGAAVASVAVFSKNPLFIVTAGIMFVWSSISVIVQVISFKSTGKRVFLMSPFHHHLEMKGMSEARISAVYLAVTLVFGALTLALEGI